jgi:hypothetical protein
MNRRGFFSKLAVVAAGFTILPSATTYARIWKPTQGLYVLNTPEFEMPFSTRDFAGVWRFVSFSGKLDYLELPNTPHVEFCTDMNTIKSIGVT